MVFVLLVSCLTSIQNLCLLEISFAAIYNKMSYNITQVSSACFHWTNQKIASLSLSLSYNCLSSNVQNLPGARCLENRFPQIMKLWVWICNPFPWVWLIHVNRFANIQHCPKPACFKFGHFSNTNGKNKTKLLCKSIQTPWNHKLQCILERT